MNEEAKIYGICLMRLKHQIKLAEQRINNTTGRTESHYLLESYNSADITDIVDILEIYDIAEHTIEALRESLDDLAFTISVLTGEKLFFDLTEQGHWGLYLMVPAYIGLSAAGKQ